MSPMRERAETILEAIPGLRITSNGSAAGPGPHSGASVHVRPTA